MQQTGKGNVVIHRDHDLRKRNKYTFLQSTPAPRAGEHCRKGCRKIEGAGRPGSSL